MSHPTLLRASVKLVALHMSELAAILAREENLRWAYVGNKQEGELVKNDVEDGTQASALQRRSQSADKHGQMGAMILQI